MAERVVDALEVVEVEVEDRELRATVDPGQLLLQMLAEQCPVRQVGQWIVVCQMRDPLLSALALGDIFVRRNPSAFGQRLIHDLN